MKRIFKLVYIIIFILICFAPMILYIIGLFGFQGERVNIEKTEAAKFPGIINEQGINSSFDDEFEKWLGENLPFRKELISVSNLFLSDFLHNPSSNVITGKDGWLYSKLTVDDYMDNNALSDEELLNTAITLSLIEEGLKDKGAGFLFVPVPNKNSIYPEYMPVRYSKADENSLDRLYRLLDEENVNYVNLEDALITVKSLNKGNLDQSNCANVEADGSNAENSGFGDTLYYRKDTHWTSLGAAIGYRCIMDGLDKNPVQMDLNLYSRKSSRVGDLDKLLFPAFERLSEEYLLDEEIDCDSFEFTNPSDAGDTKALLESFMSDREDHDNNFTTRKIRAVDNSRLYMIRDSFARALLPYMIASYDEATFVRTKTPSFESVSAETDVIYEICERNIRNVCVSAPYIYAPQRDRSDLCLYEYASSLNTCRYSDEGYALRIYGTIDAGMRSHDGRIYVSLYDDKDKVSVYEAFPIYEEEIPGESGPNTSGYSLYIDKGNLSAKSYNIKVSSGENESEVLAVYELDENEKAEEETSQNEIANIYGSENGVHSIVFRNIEFGIGDNIRTLIPLLGDQAAPSEVIESCLSGEDAVLYYYPDITIETDRDGLIYYISLMQNSYSDNPHLDKGKKAGTVGGISLGSDKMDIWSKLGSPDRENDKNCTYNTEHIEVTYSYKSGLVSSVILQDRKYVNDSAVEEEPEGVKYEGGKTYLYDDDNLIKKGWRIIDGDYYFFDRMTGERIVGETIDGIEIDIDGMVNLSDYDKRKIETMIKAHDIVDEVTLPDDSMEDKRRKVFDWVLSFPYHRYRHIRDCYKEEGIEIIEANDIFDEGAGDCVSESAALAFLFHEIGYNNVYWVHDTGHSWVRSDDRLYDPLFAESRSFEANYDASFTDYRQSMEHSMLIY